MPTRRLSRAELIKQAQLAAVDADKHCQRMAKLHGPLRVGHIVTLPLRVELDTWLIAKEHPEDPRLLLAVPADPWRVSEVGPLDVESTRTIKLDCVAPGFRTPEYVYRCNFSLWLEQVLVGDLPRADVATRTDVARVQELLHKLFAGESIASPEEHEAWAYDDDYMEWCGVVERSREAAFQWHEMLGTVIRVEDTQAEPPSVLRRVLPKLRRLFPQTEHSLPALAAKGSGPLADIVAWQREAATPRYASIDASRGLYAIWTRDRIELCWVATARDQKPPVVYQQGDQLQRVRWQPVGPAARLPQSAADIPWSGDRVVLRLGKRARPIVLLR